MTSLFPDSPSHVYTTESGGGGGGRGELGEFYHCNSTQVKHITGRKNLIACGCNQLHRVIFLYICTLTALDKLHFCQLRTLMVIALFKFLLKGHGLCSKCPQLSLGH